VGIAHLTNRTIYAVLYAFQKKSLKGIKTVQKDIDLIKQLYQKAVEQSKIEK
jgi:phage-related protein